MHRTFDSEEEKLFGKTQSRELGQGYLRAFKTNG